MSRLIANLFGRRNGEVKAVNPANAGDDLIAQEVWNSGFGPTDGNLSGETALIRQRYREQMREPVVKAGVLSNIFDVGSLTLGMTPEDPDNERDRMIAEFCTANIVNARGGVRALAEAMLFGPSLEGYGAAHIKPWECPRGKWTGKRMLYELRPKDSMYFDFQTDKFRNVTGIIDRFAEREEDRVLPRSDFAVIRLIQIFDSVYGMSDIRAADRAYCCKDAATKLRGTYIDKYIGPFLVGKVTDKKQKDTMMGVLKNARASGYIVLPEGSEVEVLSLAMGSEEAFKSAIADWNEEMAICLTGAHLQMLAGQVPGGPGRTDQHAKSAKLKRWYLARLICDTIDQDITPRFVDENFSGSPAYPKATLEGTDPQDILTDLQIADLKLSMGGKVSIKELDERSGWGSPEDELDTLVKALPPDPFGPLTDPNADPAVVIAGAKG